MFLCSCVHTVHEREGGSQWPQERFHKKHTKIPFPTSSKTLGHSTGLGCCHYYRHYLCSISTLSLHFRLHSVWALAPFQWEKHYGERHWEFSHWRYCAFVEAVLVRLGGTALQRWTCATSTISSPSDRLPHSPYLPSFGLSCLSTLVEQKYTQTRRKPEQRKKTWTHTHARTQTL